MSRIFGLLLVALAILVIVVFLANPELIETVWLWLVGFIGYIIYFSEKGLESLKNLFKKDPAITPPLPPEQNKEHVDTSYPLEKRSEKEAVLKNLPENYPETWELLGGSYLTLLRYLDDGNTSLGLLYLGKQFFCYTLEDTHRDEKVPAGTRIPEGRYPLSVNPTLTDLTKRYRSRFPWFDYHIEINNIPNYDLVYLHIGNSHQDTRGCILLADGVNTGSSEKMVTHSQRAFERFYKTVYPKISSQENLEIKIFNEDWMERAGIRQKSMQDAVNI
ncbi:DUF5675 family protein [Cyclobacterium jeungdonense]|uniref:DUF5675 family protein n=1 Tax=Cyclobacterium jeungdonense TaxID=708087 RepID=A0ABT8CB54_9BACT|nr:DUF5675 family protein [Cyclobacterium jeungdonense]MDN3690024.1 DUF5675 family protein [Cyclobacterium jeungdonense]